MMEALRLTASLHYTLRGNYGDESRAHHHNLFGYRALFAGPGLAAEPAEVEKFVNARIDIGEMMTNYFTA